MSSINVSWETTSPEVDSLQKTKSMDNYICLVLFPEKLLCKETTNTCSSMCVPRSYIHACIHSGKMATM